MMRPQQRWIILVCLISLLLITQAVGQCHNHSLWDCGTRDTVVPKSTNNLGRHNKDHVLGGGLMMQFSSNN